MKNGLQKVTKSTFLNNSVDTRHSKIPKKIHKHLWVFFFYSERWELGIDVN